MRERFTNPHQALGTQSLSPDNPPTPIKGTTLMTHQGARVLARYGGTSLSHRDGGRGMPTTYYATCIACDYVGGHHRDEAVATADLLTHTDESDQGGEAAWNPYI